MGQRASKSDEKAPPQPPQRWWRTIERGDLLGLAVACGSSALPVVAEASNQRPEASDEQPEASDERPEPLPVSTPPP